MIGFTGTYTDEEDRTHLEDRQEDLLEDDGIDLTPQLRGPRGPRGLRPSFHFGKRVPRSAGRPYLAAAQATTLHTLCRSIHHAELPGSNLVASVETAHRLAATVETARRLSSVPSTNISTASFASTARRRSSVPPTRASSSRRASASSARRASAPSSRRASSTLSAMSALSGLPALPTLHGALSALPVSAPHDAGKQLPAPHDASSMLNIVRNGSVRRFSNYPTDLDYAGSGSVNQPTDFAEEDFTGGELAKHSSNV